MVAKTPREKILGDQEGAGQVIGISCGTKLCQVRALRAWIKAANITDGPIFARWAVTEIFWAAGSAGSGDRGQKTQAAMNGVPEHAIMRRTRHKSTDMLREYLRDGELFRDNASGRIGL